MPTTSTNPPRKLSSLFVFTCFFSENIFFFLPSLMLANSLSHIVASYQPNSIYEAIGSNQEAEAG